MGCLLRRVGDWWRQRQPFWGKSNQKVKIVGWFGYTLKENRFDLTHKTWKWSTKCYILQTLRMGMSADRVSHPYRSSDIINAGGFRSLSSWSSVSPPRRAAPEVKGPPRSRSMDWE